MHSQNHTSQEANSIKADMHSMCGVKAVLPNKWQRKKIPILGVLIDLSIKKESWKRKIFWKIAFLTNIDRNGKKDLGADAQGSTFKMLSLVLKNNDIRLESFLYVQL